MEAPELADVVLVVEGERFPAHRNVLAARSEYFRGLLLSGMQEGSGQQEISLEEVSAGAFRVVLRYLYTAAVPAWEELQGTETSAEEDGAAGGGHGGRGKGGGKGGGKGTGNSGSKGKSDGKGKGKEAADSEEDEGAGRAALELEVLKAEDLFQAEGLLKHWGLRCTRWWSSWCGRTSAGRRRRGRSRQSTLWPTPALCGCVRSPFVAILGIRSQTTSASERGSLFRSYSTPSALD